MTTEADIPDPISRTKGEVEGKDLTCGELLDVTINENNTEIPTESRNGEHKAVDRKEPEENNGTHCTVSSTEDQTESDTVVTEKTGETQEQDNGSYAEEETPFVAKTTEDSTIEMEDDSVSAKSKESAGTVKESANIDALEQEMNTPSQMNNGNGRPNTSELENYIVIGKLEASKDENSSDKVIEKDKSENEMTINEASEGAIMEQEESTKNIEGISKESVETEKASVEFEAEGDSNGSNATEAQNICTPLEKNIESAEDGENPISAPESTVEDISKRACPETNRTNVEEEINNDQNQSTDSIKEASSAKQLLREIEKGDESVINKEQTTEEESCTKEASVDENHEIVRKEMDLHLAPTQELQVPPLRKAPEEEIEVIEKPVNLSSLESLASENKIIIEKIEETEDRDDDTDIAPSVVTEVSLLGEAKLNDESVKTLDTTSEAKGPEMVKTADTRQQDAEIDGMKLEGTSILVSDLLTYEHEKAEIVGICKEKSDAIDFEVEKVPGAVSESEVQVAEENDEGEIVTSLTVGEIDTNKIQEQIRDAPESLSEQLNQVVKSDGKDEIAPVQTIQDEKIVTLCNEEDSETKTAIEKTEDRCIKREDTEVDTNKVEEQIEGPSKALSEPIGHGVEAASKDEIASGLTPQAEKMEELFLVSSYALPSNDENDETTTTVEKTEDGCKRNEDTEDDTNNIGDASEGLSEPIDQIVEATAKDENAPCPSLQAGKIEEQSQVTSSVVLSSAEDAGTTATNENTADGCTKKDDTEVDTSVTTDGGTPGVVLQTLSTTCESENHATVEKSDVDIVKFEETETLEAVSEPKGTGFEEIHDSETISTAEITNTGKIEEEIKGNEKISDQGAENDTTIEKIEDGSTKKVEAEVDNVKLEETTVALSKFPSIDIAQPLVTEVSILGEDKLNDKPAKAFGTSSDAETPETTKADDSSQQDAEVDCMNCEDTSSAVPCLPRHEHEEADDVSAHEEKSDAIGINAEEKKIADAKSESEVLGYEEIYETDRSPTVGETDTNDIEEKISDAPEALLEPINQGVKSESKDETTPVQTLQAEKIEEQLQVSSSDLLPTSEDGKTITILEKTENECTKKDDEEVDTDAIEEEIEDASKAVSKPINQGVEATSKDENIPSPALQGETTEEHLVETNELKEQAGDALEALYELIKQRVEAASNDEIAPGPTLQAEKTEEQLQVSSFAIVSNEEDDETQTTNAWTEDGCKRRDDTDVDTNGVEEQTVDARETLSEPINQGVEADSNDEIALGEALYELIKHRVEAASNDEIAPGPTLQAEKTEEQLQVSSSAIVSNQEDDETQTANAWTEDGCKKRDDTDVDTNGVEEQTVDARETLSEPINQGVEADSNDEIALGEALYELIKQRVEAASNDEIAPGPTLQTEKTEEQLQVSSSTMVSNEEDDENQTTIAWTEDGCTRRDDTGVDTNGVEEQTVDVRETLSELINQGVEADSNDEIAVGPTIQAKEIEEQLQVSSSVVLSNEEYGETATTIEKTEDGCTKKNETEAGNLELEEAPGVVSQPLSTACESANNASVKSNTVKIEENKTLKAISEPEDLGFEEIHGTQKSPTAEITDTHQVVENDTTMEKIEGESTAYVRAELDTIKLEEATTVLSQFSTTEDEVVDKENATVEKSEQNKFEVEEAKTSEVVSESELHGAAKGSTKGDETQLNEKEADSFEARATEKPTFQNEEPRELDFPKTENEFVDKESATVEKSEGNEFEVEEAKISDVVSERELHGAAKESTKEDETQLHEKVADSFEAGATEKPSLQNAELRELDVSNFDRMAQMDSQNQAPEQERRSLEDDSEVEPQGYIPEAEKTPAYCSSEDTSKDENAIDLSPPHPTIKELSIEEGEAIKKDTSVEKITEEKEATTISHPVSRHEEIVTKSNQEDELLYSPKREGIIIAEPYQGEKSATLEKQSNEIQHEELFDKQTAAGAASIVEGGKSIRIENHITDEDPVELSTNGNENNLVEPKFQITTTANGDEGSQHLNKKPNVVSDGKNTEVSHDKNITDYEITKDAKELEKGVESGEEKKPGEGCQETAKRSIMMDTDRSSQKKSHNLLSGVGSKMKHSIAKVKKLITGKSSHPKTSSPPKC